MQPSAHWTYLSEHETVARMSADRELVDAVLAGRSGAFERLVREYQGLVAHIVFRLVRHTDDAHDLCQEAFLRVYRQLRQFREDGTLKAWIGRVAYSTALRHLEKRRAVGPLVDIDVHDDDAYVHGTVETDLEQHHSDRELAERVRSAVDALPPRQRVLVCLYHLDGLPISDIATITGMPAGTIKNALFRARRVLRLALEQANRERP
jgi:RNA polymerase sigma factor (sigma-70 family)